MTDNTLLAEYIEKNLNGVIPENYKNEENRIHVLEAAGSTADNKAA